MHRLLTALILVTSLSACQREGDSANDLATSDLAVTATGDLATTADLSSIDTTIPAVPALSVTYAIKTFDFAWEAVDGASAYHLYEDPDGSGTYTQIGGELAGTTYDHTVALYRRLGARYTLEACNSVGCSARTAPLSPVLTPAIGYLKASTPGMGDQLGYSIALSGDGNTLAVGAPFESSAAKGVGGDQTSDAAAQSGAAYVYVRNGLAWTQQAYVKASNTGAGDQFGTKVSLSADGSTLAVSAPHESGNSTAINGPDNDAASQAGAVYVFTRAGTTWSQQAYVKASNAGANDGFGYVISLSADGATLAVGAPSESSNASGVGGNASDNSLSGSGAAYVFSRAGTIWSQLAYVKASNPDEDDQFGQAIALSGDASTLVVGAPSEWSSSTGVNGNELDNSTQTAGAAYVFVRSGSSFAQQAYVKASTTGMEDLFAWGLALSNDGSTLAVGSLGDFSKATGVNGDETDRSATFAGAVHVFTRTGTTWSQQAYVKASNTDAHDQFGPELSLSADGDTLAVGAVVESSDAIGIGGNQTSNADFEAGAVYVFSRTAGAWAQSAYVKSSNTAAQQLFGSGVALSSDGLTLAVGAEGDASKASGIGGDQTDTSLSQAGAVHLY